MLSQQHKKNTTTSLILKLGAISFLLFLSFLVVACGGNDTSQLGLGTPVATITINLGQAIGSPTPPLKDHYCGGWATDTTPPFIPNSIVNVYAKFIRIDPNGNPEGVANATAIATIYWPDLTTDTMTQTTTSDGLVVFPIAIKPSALNKEVTINIAFTDPTDKKQCSITASPAYFTAILVSPTPTNTAVPSPTNTGTPSLTPTGSPTPGGTGTPSVTPTFTPSPTPTKPPH
jgi:hypothetical protein